ncbi:MAG: hypothetical protein HC903_23660 [Methylacidiphilales bacterium]|nr:hypothetical protein [Candidatus Methylacidiphilales bacterium]NJR16472.1 hypothetical protein [Calothrix sp. CSU_2_0]
MRVAISLLITTFFLGSLTVNDQNLSPSSSETPQTMASKAKSGKNRKKPEQPIPHRGSGRRELMEYSFSSDYLV